MKPIKVATFVHMALLVLLLAACGAHGTAGTTSTATAPVGPTPTTSVERVEFRGISVTYDRALTAQVTPRYVPASEQMGTVVPEHIEVDFDPERTHLLPGLDTGIRVFRVRDLQEIDPMYRAGVAALEPMPLIPGSRMLRVNERLLSFANGKGSRAIVAYAGQDIGPLTNQDILYSYAGITDDGLYYVSATFPVAAPFLRHTVADGFPGMPSTTPGEPGYHEAYVAAMNRFNREATERLDGLDAEGFQPDLRRLDALIRSLVAAEAQEWSIGPGA
jgi:hypothetical protein